MATQLEIIANQQRTEHIARNDYKDVNQYNSNEFQLLYFYP